MISYVADVLVIKAGAASLRAATAVDQQRARVLVVGKRPRDDAHALLAPGGINAALATMDPEDNWAIRAADILREGQFLATPGLLSSCARRRRGN